MSVSTVGWWMDLFLLTIAGSMSLVAVGAAACSLVWLWRWIR